MQKLEEINTYTPTDIPHVSGNCEHAKQNTKELTLLEIANTFLIAPLKRGTLLHTLKSMVSATPYGVL